MLASTYIPPYPNTTRDVLLVVAACFGALELFQWLFAQWAMLRIWESWIPSYPVLGTYGPFFAIAILTGVVVGACVAALARARSKRNLAWSAALACILSLAAAAVAGGFAWAVSEPTVLLGPSIGVGLVVGRVVVRKVAHA
jgi:hypothetical protein